MTQALQHRGTVLTPQVQPLSPTSEMNLKIKDLLKRYGPRQKQTKLSTFFSKTIAAEHLIENDWSSSIDRETLLNATIVAEQTIENEWNASLDDDGRYSFVEGHYQRRTFCCRVWIAMCKKSKQY